MEAIMFGMCMTVFAAIVGYVVSDIWQYLKN